MDTNLNLQIIIFTKLLFNKNIILTIESLLLLSNRGACANFFLQK